MQRNTVSPFEYSEVPLNSEARMHEHSVEHTQCCQLQSNAHTSNVQPLEHARTYTHALTHTHLHTHTRTHTHGHLHTRTYTQALTRTHLHALTHTHTLPRA